jgi:hypothetical protein
VSHLAYAVEAADVRTVVIDGHVVVQDRVLLTADDTEIKRRVRELPRRDPCRVVLSRLAGVARPVGESRRSEIPD